MARRTHTYLSGTVYASDLPAPHGHMSRDVNKHTNLSFFVCFYVSSAFIMALQVQTFDLPPLEKHCAVMQKS